MLYSTLVPCCDQNVCAVLLYLQLFVGGFMSNLHNLCLFTNSGVQYILCCVFLRLAYPMLPVSLDCQFLIVPSVFSKVYLEQKMFRLQRWNMLHLTFTTGHPCPSKMAVTYEIFSSIIFTVSINTQVIHQITWSWVQARTISQFYGNCLWHREQIGLYNMFRGDYCLVLSCTFSRFTTG